jgi:hypothetical protein
MHLLPGIEFVAIRLEQIQVFHPLVAEAYYAPLVKDHTRLGDRFRFLWCL